MGSKIMIVCLLILGLASSQPLLAQDDEDKPKKTNFNGYLKVMETINVWPNGSLWAPHKTDLTSGTLIHNRLNFKWFPHKNWTLAAEGRNRAFYGEEVKLQNSLQVLGLPSYGDQIDANTGLVDLSVLWVNDSAFVLHSVLDRFYLDYTKGKFEFRVGRQRINWGINSVWNPNDLFNAFNYLDFDYVERPGSDAVRFTYYTGLMSNIELAFSPQDSLKNSTGGLIYRFNTKGYDVQALAGYYKGDIAIGTGWAGYIGGAGFQGEATYFHPTDASADSMGTFTASISGDYSFSTALYLAGSVYYNNRGATSASIFNTGALSQGVPPSAKNLFPTRWAFFLSGSSQIDPLWSAGLSIIYSPYGNQTTFIPTITHSVKENWDLDLIAQSFFLEQNDKFQNLITSIYVRLKWSF